MDCLKVKDLLMEYVEGSLDKDLSREVRRHLSSCKACAAEAASFANYKKTMASLENRKAPADFMIGLNKRLEKRSGFSGMLRALFFPLKIKLPIEAAGLLATIVVTIMLFNTTGQIKKGEFAPGSPGMDIVQNEHAKIAGSAAEDADSIGSKSFSSAPPAPSKAGKEIALADNRSVSRSAPRIETYEIALIVHKAASFEQEEAADEGFYPQTRIQAKQFPSESGKTDSITAMSEKESSPRITGKIISAGKDRKETDETADKKAELKSAPETAAPVEAPPDLSVLRHAEPVVTGIDPVQEIRDIVAGLKGTVAEERKREDGSAVSIIAEIPAAGVREFIGRLKAIGSIDPAAGMPEGAGTGRVRFRINIIKE